MNRLTSKPENNKTNYKVRIKGKKWYDELQNAINKLGELENLEEELGCPLEVVFKAIRIGIVIKDNSHLRLPDFGIYNGKFAFYSVGANNSMLAHRNIFYTKDYQKTWWVKGEKDA